MYFQQKKSHNKPEKPRKKREEKFATLNSDPDDI
jgi:hypothetical protein